MTTRRENILNALKSQLETISIANGYLTDVETVESVVKDWDSCESGTMPWIGFCSDPREGTTFQPTPTKRLVATFNIAIIAHIIATPGAAKNAALSNLESDLIKCLYANHTLDGYCRDIQINDSLTDEGDDMLYPNKPVGTIVQTWEISYFISTTNPSA